jgi:hypothetical protein
MRFALIAMIAALPLAACEGNVKDGEAGTTVSIDAEGNSGDAVLVTADGNSGEVAVNVPGFEGKIDIPKFVLDNGDFDIDGVRLYPGSKITKVNVNAKSGDGNDAKVDMAFTAPASPDKVTDYLKSAFAEKKMKVTVNGAALSGTTTDGSPFAIALQPGEGGTAGTIKIDAK